MDCPFDILLEPLALGLHTKCGGLISDKEFVKAIERCKWRRYRRGVEVDGGGHQGIAGICKCKYISFAKDLSNIGDRKIGSMNLLGLEKEDLDVDVKKVVQVQKVVGIG